MDDMIKDATQDFLFDAGTGTRRYVLATIEAATRAGYELGLQKGREDLEAACDAAFDSGFEYGKTEGALESEVGIEDAMSDSFDDGYLEGVADARRLPGFADAMVQDILAVRAEDHYEALFEDDMA